MKPKKPGAPLGNKNASIGDANNGRVDIRLPKATIAAMKAATYVTGDRGIAAFIRRLIQQELDRLEIQP